MASEKPHKAARREESAKPTQPPAADFSTMEKAWYDNLKRPDGQPYEVFNNQTLTKWKRWVGGEFEYDGQGLRDTVDANAQYLDEVKNDLDQHRTADNTRHAVVRQDITEIRAALEALSVPFPG